MTRLTIYVVGVQQESGTITGEALEAEFVRQGASLRFAEFDWLEKGERAKAAEQYNDTIGRGAVPGLSIVVTPLTPNPRAAAGSASWFPASIDEAGRCFDELHRALKEFCRKYDVVDARAD